MTPALPIPRRALPWLSFAGGMVLVAFGSWQQDIATLAIGVVAVAGALLAWAGDAYLRGGPPSEPEQPAPPDERE